MFDLARFILSFCQGYLFYVHAFPFHCWHDVSSLRPLSITTNHLLAIN